MRAAIDDFPFLGASRFRASGVIRPEDESVVISASDFFPPSGDAVLTVGLHHLKFPNGGGWSFFVCLCGRRCRTLRLYEGGLACHGCLKARGFRNRVELIETHKRAAYHAPRLLARLTGPPARLYPQNGRMLDRRSWLEAKLRRSLIVARQHAVDEHERMLKR
jgi:hypothetical protein